MVAIDRPMSKLVDTNGGRVSREIFCNQEIYDQEMEQVFARSWLFVGHESQIPNVGDFMRSRMGEEQVIVTRDKDHQIHVLLNSCRHRGNMVCRYDEGNALAFTCSFHGWVYDTSGAIVGLPFNDGGYDGMPKQDWGLLQARVELFQGTIWATWDRTAPALSITWAAVSSTWAPSCSALTARRMEPRSLAASSSGGSAATGRCRPPTWTRPTDGSPTAR